MTFDPLGLKLQASLECLCRAERVVLYELGYRCCVMRVRSIRVQIERSSCGLRGGDGSDFSPWVRGRRLFAEPRPRTCQRHRDVKCGVVGVDGEPLFAGVNCRGEVPSTPFDRGEYEERCGVGQCGQCLVGEFLREVEVVISQLDFGEQTKGRSVVGILCECDADSRARVVEASQGEQVSGTLLGVVGVDHDHSDRIVAGCVEESA